MTLCTTNFCRVEHFGLLRHLWSLLPVSQLLVHHYEPGNDDCCKTKTVHAVCFAFVVLRLSLVQALARGMSPRASK